MSVEKLIFEKGAPGRRAATMTAMDVPAESLESMIPEGMLRKEPAPLPEASEIEVVRHYTHLSQRNFGVDTGFYPLGSCTMKYNPKINEDMASLPGFAQRARMANSPASCSSKPTMRVRGRDIATSCSFLTTRMVLIPPALRLPTTNP